MARMTWKQPASLPQYECSSSGMVRRTKFIGAMPNGGKRVYGGGDGWPGAWHKSGRYIFRFGTKTYSVSRLVCEAFNGPPPFAGAVCMHINEDARDNRPKNLRWGTQKENLNAPGFIAYCRSGKAGKRTKVKA